VFARAAFASDPTFKGPSVADTLTVGGFAQAWNYTTALLSPELVSSLSAPRFVQLAASGAHTLPPPPLHDVFERLFASLRSNTSVPHRPTAPKWVG
jgi:hypothetical protein